MRRQLTLAPVLLVMMGALVAAQHRLSPTRGQSAAPDRSLTMQDKPDLRFADQSEPAPTLARTPGLLAVPAKKPRLPADPQRAAAAAARVAGDHNG